MKPLNTIALVALLATTLAGCGNVLSISDDHGKVTYRHDIVTLHVQGHSDAVIDANGSLSIGGKPVALTSAQRALLVAYHNQFANFRSAIGWQDGVDAAKEARQNIDEAIADAGNDKDASARVERRKQEIQTRVLAICAKEDALQASQNLVAAALPAFKPYAAIVLNSNPDCHKDAKNHD